ncbi:MAG: hypothetical protein K0A98_10470 [Trueperaceae bacterium]|nr:hypothetical protein [Trueperaceae bacterium]
MSDRNATLKAAGADAGAGPPPPLDEVMLAMDVVDTLRHREELVAQELARGDRDAALLERLRRTYAAQGIEVPEHVLLDGVAALREDRFAYRPAPPSLARSLATVYVRRGLWLRRLLVVVAVAAVAALAYQQAVVAPRRALVGGLSETHAAIVALANEPAAQTRAAALVADGRAALVAGDREAAGRALEALEGLRADLERAYELRIVVGDGVTSGVWRVPEDNARARNYYLIVEAIDASGRRLTLPILSEETGRMERVSSWGLRVDEATWNRVAADKADDGIIQQRTVGRKVAGELEPTYLVETTGGAITRW